MRVILLMTMLITAGCSGGGQPAHCAVALAAANDIAQAQGLEGLEWSPPPIDADERVERAQETLVGSDCGDVATEVRYGVVRIHSVAFVNPDLAAVAISYNPYEVDQPGAAVQCIYQRAEGAWRRAGCRVTLRE